MANRRGHEIEGDDENTDQRKGDAREENCNERMLKEGEMKACGQAHASLPGRGPGLPGRSPGLCTVSRILLGSPTLACNSPGFGEHCSR